MLTLYEDVVMLPDEYKTEHLVLLVGSNPLPNLVAAQVLLRPGGTLHLVYSSETLKITERLRTYLQRLENPPVIAPILKVDPMNAGDIQNKIKARLREITSDSIGLHYTGGTKAMAVHVYREIEADCKTRGIQSVFSYLDKDTFSVRVDPEWYESVLFAVQPKLEDLAILHGAPLRKNSPRRADGLVCVEAAAALARSVEDGGLARWCKWVSKAIEQAQTETVMAVNLPDDEVLAEVTAQLKHGLGLADDAAAIPKAQFSPLIKWFNGEWLEHYVLAQIIKIAPQVRIHDWGMGLATNQSKSAGAEFDFEFDVAALRGYQFFGISCGTSTDKETAKLKLFEAYIRARQLGGDEARVGLICGYENAQRFEHEVVQAWQAQNKIKVFGPYDLPNLGDHLARWFKTAQSTKEVR
jgi:hypothetical protein